MQNFDREWRSASIDRPLKSHLLGRDKSQSVDVTFENHPDRYYRRNMQKMGNRYIYKIMSYKRFINDLMMLKTYPKNMHINFQRCVIDTLVIKISVWLSSLFPSSNIWW